jgi:catechol 2,3-dioxygenase-like lactoylglutathione lyase family enzyme
MPSLTGVLETSLYVDDLARSIQFYQSVLGLQILEQDDRFCALNVSGRQVLLLFLKGASTNGSILPGGRIPPHDGEGQLHLAFAIAAAELAAWEQQLQEKGVPIKSTVAWSRGGHSLYFRDPDDHLLELATPGVWSTY